MKKNRIRQTDSLRNKLIAFALACTAALALASCTQSAAADVGEQSARETAFAHAGVSQDDVLSLEVKKSTEDGVAVYEVQFTTADRSYDYDVEQSSGEIVKSSFQPLAGGQASANDGAEKDQTSSQAAAAVSQASDGAQSSAQTGTAASQTSGQQPSGGQSTSTGITEDEAKAIALQDAGVSESDVVFVRVERDRDDGRSCMTWSSMPAIRSTITRSTAPTRDLVSRISTLNPTPSPAGTARSSPWRRPGTWCLPRCPALPPRMCASPWTRDDGRQTYEGELYYNQMEYEFEMDASTGNFIEWSAEAGIDRLPKKEGGTAAARCGFPRCTGERT